MQTLFSLQIVNAVLSRSVEAYIDPNTGGMLFQILAVLFAAFSGIMLFFSRQIKTYFARFMRFLRQTIKPGQPDQIEQPEKSE